MNFSSELLINICIYLITQSVLPFNHVSKLNKESGGDGGDEGDGEVANQITPLYLPIKNSSTFECHLCHGRMEKNILIGNWM